MGHIEANCFKNAKILSFNGTRKRDQQENKGGDQQKKSFVMFLAGTNSFNDNIVQKWFVDSKNSAHICNNEAFFTTMQQNMGSQSVSVGDGSYLEIKGVGTVFASTVVDGVERKVILKEVLLVT